MLSSQSHRADDANWVSIGSGEWDREGRGSYIRLDRVLEVEEHGIRREGAVLDRDRFDVVANELRAGLRLALTSTGRLVHPVHAGHTPAGDLRGAVPARAGRLRHLRASSAASGRSGGRAASGSPGGRSWPWSGWCSDSPSWWARCCSRAAHGAGRVAARCLAAPS